MSGPQPGTPQSGDEVYTEDGRRAVYSGIIDGQHFVRIVRSCGDEEYGYEEWPSDKLTPVSRVLSAPPEELYAPQIEAARASLEALRMQMSVARGNVLDLQKQEQEIAAAINKFPELGAAIDFLEGRFTHVVVMPSYGAGKIETLSDYLMMKNDYGRSEGIKLVCLFGTKDREKPRWKINRYYDGSGSWFEVHPFKSEEEARAFLHEDFDAELMAWRSGEKHNAHSKCAAIPVEEWPDDWRAYCADLKDKNAAERIAKLREEIAKIEAEQVLK